MYRGSWLIGKTTAKSIILVIFAFFTIVRWDFREMGTPEARNLISVRCDLFFLEEGEK